MNWCIHSNILFIAVYNINLVIYRKKLVIKFISFSFDDNGKRTKEIKEFALFILTELIALTNFLSFNHYINLWKYYTLYI